MAWWRDSCLSDCNWYCNWDSHGLWTNRWSSEWYCESSDWVDSTLISFVNLPRISLNLPINEAKIRGLSDKNRVFFEIEFHRFQGQLWKRILWEYGHNHHAYLTCRVFRSFYWYFHDSDIININGSFGFENHSQPTLKIYVFASLGQNHLLEPFMLHIGWYNNKRFHKMEGKLTL